MKLWDHQIACIELAKELDCFALFHEMGTGKSCTLINILRNKYKERNQILNTLILCPPIVIKNWKNEFSKFSKIDPDRIIPLIGTGKEREALILSQPNTAIYITNYESLNMPPVFQALKERLSETPSILVLDESHRAKDHTAKRTQRAIELGDTASYRYILTGTPILRNLMDIWSQFRILDRGERFGKNFWTYRAMYFEDKNKAMPKQKHFPKWEVIAGAEDKIKALMAPVSMHVEKKDCLTLPPLIRKTVNVELGKEQKRLYDDMKRDLVATVTMENGENKHSIAELAITKALRLQQIVSGHVRYENEGDVNGTLTIKDNPRKEALKEILEDIGPNHKILIWAVFHANYDDIRSVCDELEIGYTEIHGLVKDKDANANKFRTDPNCRVLIGHPGSGGIGLNLVEASYMIYYSRSFSLEYDLQSEARNFRGGSEMHQKITRIDIVAQNTIDELVLKSLASKQELSDKILKESLKEL